MLTSAHYSVTYSDRKECGRKQRKLIVLKLV
jgi:hypothetical protein